jgi:hypothetical protein
MQKEMMEKIAGPDLAVFVVWSSQLGAEEKHIAGGMELIPDPRARHYWDPGRVLGHAYQGSLMLDGDRIQMTGPAWDTWLLFAQGTRWDDAGPPAPAWWETQLSGMPGERQLDAKRFAGHARELMSGGGA